MPLTPKLQRRFSDDILSVFSDLTNSYKILFFLSLLRLLRIPYQGNDAPTLTLKEIGVEMVALAWYPSKFFRLSFGMQDQMWTVIDRLKFRILSPGKLGYFDSQKSLRSEILKQWESINGEKLLRYVPHRFLSPFFSKELRGIKDSVKNSLIQKLSNEMFNVRQPIYKLSEDAQSLHIHPLWNHYLTSNYGVIEGWANWCWVQFLQKRNPNVPAIPEKVSPKLDRGTLTWQRDVWKKILQRKSFVCIYSNLGIRPESFVLDHYVPWSFVCHDNLWNLLPVSPEANSSKSDSLPDPSYFEAFFNQQYEGLMTIKDQSVISHGLYKRVVQSYSFDLHLSASDELFDEKRLKDAFLKTIPPLLTQAEQVGFQPGWRFMSE